MSRLLTRVVPALTTPILRNAARDYTRAFLNSYRRGTSSLRQVAPIDLQFDRFAEVERFRRETWQRLHDRARARPAIAEAIDARPIAASLGVHTPEHATTMLGLRPARAAGSIRRRNDPAGRRDPRHPRGHRRHAREHGIDDDRPDELVCRQPHGPQS